MGKKVIKAILAEKEYGMSIVNIRGIDDRIHRAFKEYCRDEGTSMGEMLNTILGKIVEEYVKSPDKE